MADKEIFRSMTAAERHRHEAEHLRSRAREQTYADAGARLDSAATVHALLALEARVAELVSQQRLANVLSACAIAEHYLSSQLREDAWDYIRARIRNLVDPGPSTESEQS